MQNAGDAPHDQSCALLTSLPRALNATKGLERSPSEQLNPDGGVDVRLALYQPDIPQNTGTILRMAACLDVAVDVIGPTGFDMSNRSLRRAGLDYLEHVTLTRHASFEVFEAARLRPAPAPRLILLTSHGAQSHLDFAFQLTDVIVLGRESAGVPESIHRRADARIRIPMVRGLRSLNIAIAGALVLGEALRQTRGFPGRSA